MSIDIQKQINFRAQNNNIINAPQQLTNELVEQPVDEEKSNAAKWMIGLTATAAIVIGGIYAAKKGHLGKTAEKYANKLFGTTDSVKPKPDTGSSTANSSTCTGSSTSVGTTTSSSTVASATASVAALIPIPLLRKAIKKPNLKLSEFIADLQRNGIKFERQATDANTLIVRTSETDLPTLLKFDKDGALEMVRKPFKEAMETFTYEKGKLKAIKRLIKTSDDNNPIEHIREFTNGKFSGQQLKFKLPDGTDIRLSSIDGYPNAFQRINDTDWDSRTVDFLVENFDSLPKSIKKAKIYDYPHEVVHAVGLKNAPAKTLRLYAHINDSLASLPKEISSVEIVRIFYRNDDPNLMKLAQQLDIERNIARRVDDVKGVMFNDIGIIARETIDSGMTKADEIKETLSKILNLDTRKAEIFGKLLGDDLGMAKQISDSRIITAVHNYQTKFKAYGLDKNIDLMETSVKPLKECSYDEVVKLVKEISPKKAANQGVQADPWKNKDEEQKAIFTLLKRCTGQSGIDENTKLFDLLKDIAI